MVNVNDDEVHSLRDLLDAFNENKYFNLIEHIDYCIQASLGLEYLHKSGIIYQDFKPATLLVNGTLGNIVVKCSDFGDVASAKSTVQSISTLNNIKGMTSAFIAPEILNRNAKPNIQTDIYALGLSIYEILSDIASPWEKTFPVYNDALLIEKVKNDERPDMKEVWNLYKEEH